MTLEQVFKAHPDLTLDGFDDPLRPGFADNRARLAAAGDQFDRAIDWLSMPPRRNVANATVGGSYHLKHLCEGAMGNYVANGALIAAALALGIIIERRGMYARLGIGAASRWPERARPKYSKIYA